VATLAITGGLVFMGSLAVGVVAYASWFGAAAAPWSAAAGLPAIAIDAALFSAFALHHSIFARTGVRRWVAAGVSPPLERTVYVWIASTLFVGLCWAWRPVPGLAWQAPWPWSAGCIALQLFGAGLSLHGARQIDVWDLAGLAQAFGRVRPAGQALVRRGLYALVRHPIYLGWILMVWPTATMTGTRLTFAALSTCYLMVAIPFEERTLRRDFGLAYDAYAREVRWRVVPFLY
jgi:protein-S-isoprenylcysteine O-methyltransferase Ste14